MFAAPIPPNAGRAAAYVRVSSQRQVDDGNSLDAQIRRIKEYVKFKGLSLADEDIIVEQGVSGGIPIWERPKGRVLQRKLLTGQFTDLVTMKLDRMFRLTTDALNTVDELNASDIHLHIVDMNGEALDTSTAMGRFFLTMMGALSEMERGLISERTQEGMDQLKSMNRRFTHAIFGWNIDPNGNLNPNWKEQDQIDFMEWQVDDNGVSATSVAKHLNKVGIKGKRGGRWTASGVLRTYQNPFHMKRFEFPLPPWWGDAPWHLFEIG